VSCSNDCAAIQSYTKLLLKSSSGNIPSCSRPNHSSSQVTKWSLRGGDASDWASCRAYLVALLAVGYNEMSTLNLSPPRAEHTQDRQSGSSIQPLSPVNRFVQNFFSTRITVSYTSPHGVFPCYSRTSARLLLFRNPKQCCLRWPVVTHSYHRP